MFILGLALILLLGSGTAIALILAVRMDLEARKNLSEGIDKSDSER